MMRVKVKLRVMKTRTPTDLRTLMTTSKLSTPSIIRPKYKFTEIVPRENILILFLGNSVV